MSDIATEFEMHAREYELEQRRQDVMRYRRYVIAASSKAEEYTTQHKGKDKPKDYDKWREWHAGQVLKANTVHDAVKQDYSKRLREFGLWKRRLKAAQA